MAGASESDAHFGRLVVEQGLATAAQVADCLGLRDELAARGVTPLPRLGASYRAPAKARLRELERR